MKKIILIIFIFMGFVALGMPSADATTSTSMAGIVNSGSANLNVRKGPSTSTNIISKLSHNSYVTVESTSGNFYYVQYKENTYGYVHKDYVKISSTNTKRVSTDGANLNVRTGPSTSYSQFEKVKDKDYVIVLSTSGSFSRVLFEGNKIGYVSSAYLLSNVSYPAVKLSVPSYKQYDSRWASLTLGSNGQTMKQIGCLTTAMAMSESYRTGLTKTPITIRNSSSYTSSGALYWPSNYTTSASSGYLQTVYSLLKQNKPVLIGLKTASGGQHWVVITGYTGSNSLNSYNFTVNDPGGTRTRLSEVIASYPYFYKIAYYK